MFVSRRHVHAWRPRVRDAIPTNLSAGHECRPVLPKSKVPSLKSYHHSCMYIYADIAFDRHQEGKLVPASTSTSTAGYEGSNFKLKREVAPRLWVSEPRVEPAGGWLKRDQ
ncbi:hypothetical protein EVG20_g9380 [Dentipellis fragilis]|uniref:Uncharacterized protein n=1 Tax=Dentipellis fragilis TaxID=205917 RepID=A0A4Y9Y105_9AGAM|nr:hypothetical protein EVG20_g9380 [Dentipellis fragilis]